MNIYSPVTLPPGVTLLATDDYEEPGVSVQSDPLNPVTGSEKQEDAGNPDSEPAQESGDITGKPSSKATPESDDFYDKPSSERPPESDAVMDALHRLLILKGFDPQQFNLEKHYSGKPYGLINGRKVGVGITHCKSLLICALHTSGETGIDVEPADRKLHPALRDRICHAEEINELPEELCSIRLWTVKEAVLKFLGTGLRLAMNKIKLDMKDEHCFHTTLNSESIKIASFLFRDHWIAIAFASEEVE